MSNIVLKVHPDDNLIAALQDLSAGQEVELEGENYRMKTDVPAKHKFLAHDVQMGDPIIMYGVLVGKAKDTIQKGEVATTQNVVHAAQEYTIEEKEVSWLAPDVSRFADKTFDGYHRADGKVGTANYWLVIPLVFCENRNIEMIRKAMVEELGYATGQDYLLNVRQLVSAYQDGSPADVLLQEEIVIPADEQKHRRTFPNVDGIKFLTHDGGCGGTRQDSDTLCALLAGYLDNPNVAGATVLSLGCQNAQVHILQDAIKKINPGFNKPLYILGQQESNSEPEFIAEAVKKTFVGLIEANKLTRKPAPLSKLTVGLECGGSDGFSGISANPAVGHFSDLLVALKGAVILSEFPELNGVEQNLTDRCPDKAMAEKFAKLMRTYHDRAIESGSGFDANPSPGNIKDGLITDAMKSAGAAKKGGTSPVIEVLDYTEQVTRPGLNLLCTPGNDVESTTGLAGSGATLTLFTTGLGTPTGNPICPVIKVSSNNKLSERMKDIIDINTGTIITGEDTIETKGAEILEYVIEVASGRKIPHSVRLVQDDFIPWKRGISL
ncbi:altronate dehydratase [Fulvivirga sp. M361]|uniref:UxaA family hydrolase n=1 Tax=Fulvivirga sp. M361 TaxID=2594266 RepID=UPI00117B32B4|nr:altronate dehydratase family protein [Fulvivirga sp. M361]TRX52061.1 altronate dehydratase [Fulvivirga sp. M361]